MKNKKTFIFQQAKDRWRVVIKGERDPAIYPSKDSAKAALKGQETYRTAIIRMGHSEYKDLK